MLSQLEKKYKALQAFDFEAESRKVIEANKAEITRLQKEQLDEGLDANGQPIRLEGRGYAPYTIARRRRIGKPIDRVTWDFTGQMRKQFFTVVQGNTFSSKANTFKFGEMISRSGPDAVGLNNQSIREFIEKFTRPQVVEQYKKKVVNI